MIRARQYPSNYKAKYWSGTLHNLFNDEQRLAFEVLQPTIQVSGQEFAAVSPYCTWKPQFATGDDGTDGSEYGIEGWRHQHERCPQTGRDHIQFFFSFTERSTRGQILRAIGIEADQWHVEPCESIQHAINTWAYCGEEKRDQASRCGCPSYAFGRKPEDGRRRRGCGEGDGTVGGRGGGGRIGGRGGGGRPSFLPIRDALRAGASDRFIWEDDTLATIASQYTSALGIARGVYETPNEAPAAYQKKAVFVYWGDTGRGKSRQVRAECHELGLRLWSTPIGARGRAHLLCWHRLSVPLQSMHDCIQILCQKSPLSQYDVWCTCDRCQQGVHRAFVRYVTQRLKPFGTY